LNLKITVRIPRKCENGKFFLQEMEAMVVWGGGMGDMRLREWPQKNAKVGAEIRCPESGIATI
jgi:hypothetical protein